MNPKTSLILLTLGVGALSMACEPTAAHRKPDEAIAARPAPEEQKEAQKEEASQESEASPAPVEREERAQADEVALEACGSRVTSVDDAPALECGKALTEADLDRLAAFGRLERLELREKPEEGVLPALGRLESLRELDFRSADELTSDDLGRLAPLPELTKLSVRHTRVGDEALPGLTRFPKLRELDLRDSAVTDAGMADLAKIRTLTRIDLRRTGVGPQGVAKLRQGRPDAEVVWEEPAKVLEDDGATFWSHGELCLDEMCARIDAVPGDRGRWDSRSRAYREVNDPEDAIDVGRFDAGRRYVHVIIDDFYADEDPPRRQLVFVEDDGELVQVFDAYVGVYGTTLLRFPGDGTARYTTDDWTAAEHYESQITEVVHTLTGDPPRLQKSEAIGTGEFINPEQLSACPFVYLRQPDGSYLYIGEILRDLRGRSAYGFQSLDLPLTHGTVHVRLSEEKHERTFLDEVYLEVDGEPVAANECADAQPWCQQGGEPRIMNPGDTLDLSFEVPEGATAIVLRARGYYVPLPQER